MMPRIEVSRNTFLVAGIAAVMPFFAVLGDPSLADSNALLRGLHGLVPSLDERGFAVFLGVGALIASYLPARRALRTDPVAALRAQ